jgi:hypothetical protein
MAVNLKKPSTHWSARRPDRRHSEHARTWYWLDQVANDPKPRTDNQALSSSSQTYAFADESGIRAKNDVPKNRRHTVITIIEAMMCEVPHLC